MLPHAYSTDEQHVLYTFNMRPNIHVRQTQTYDWKLSYTFSLVGRNSSVVSYWVCVCLCVCHYWQTNSSSSNKREKNSAIDFFVDLKFNISTWLDLPFAMCKATQQIRMQIRANVVYISA